MPDEAAGVPPGTAPATTPPGAAPDPRLLGPADVRQIVGRLGLRPAKRLGQNFVIDAGTVRRITALLSHSPLIGGTASGSKLRSAGGPER